MYHLMSQGFPRPRGASFAGEVPGASRTARGRGFCAVPPRRLRAAGGQRKTLEISEAHPIRSAKLPKIMFWIDSLSEKPSISSSVPPAQAAGAAAFFSLATRKESSVLVFKGIAAKSTRKLMAALPRRQWSSRRSTSLT